MRRTWVAALVLTMFVGSAQAASRLAFVVGNAAYVGAPLPTSANDAGLVAETLAQAGFDVTALANTSSETFGKAAAAFAAKAKGAGPDTMIVVYLAGRGLQVDGDNFFVPIDAKIARGADVAAQAMRMADLTKAINATAAKTRIFVFDLARSNSWAPEDDMPLAGGLALVAAPKGALYAFNAAPGTVAPADIAPYGAYARALCEMIQTPGLSPAVLFERVRLRVGELTDGTMIPWEDAATEDTALVPSVPFVSPAPSRSQAKIDTLGPGEAYSVVVARDSLAGYQDFLRMFPRDGLSARVSMVAAARREALFWAAAARANDARALWTYMRHYPRGAHYYDARRRLAALPASLDPPPRFEIETFPDLPPPSREEAMVIDRRDLVFDDTDWDVIPAPPASLLPPANPAFYEDLPPPPLTDPLALPLPAPVPIEAPERPPIFGRIVQPAVADRAELRTDTTMTASGMSNSKTTDAGGTVVSQIVATIEQGGRRAIVQMGLDRVVLSRTTILHDAAGSTVVQTGPGGGVLTKSVTLRETDGSWSTLVRNGVNQITADIRRNKAGIVIWASDLAPPPAIHHPPPMATLPPAQSKVPAPSAQAAPAQIHAAPAPPTYPPGSRDRLPSEAGKPGLSPLSPVAKPPMSDLSKPDRTSPATARAPVEAGTIGAGTSAAGTIEALTSIPLIGPIPPPRPRDTPRKAKLRPKAGPAHRSRKR